MIDIVEIGHCDDLRLKAFNAETRALEGRGHPLLSELRASMYWGAECWGALLDGHLVHVNVTKLGKRKKNKWEPYANWQIAYTRADMRRRGFAREVALHIRRIAVQRGCVRMKSLAGTFLGLRLHLALGDECWGFTQWNEVAVDTPLVIQGKDWSGVPPNAKQETRMKGTELRAIKALRYDIGV